MQFHTYSLTLSSGNDFQYICNSNDKQTILDFARLFFSADFVWHLQYGDMHSASRLHDRQEILNFLRLA